ncbi:hypothetical protein [Streptomyces sp. NPDC058011]|uniref:hypothetical protein n=1 Tax=Streptomyces sp. NPDC058011 TaxID=3346305 RepID=UPI0036EA36FF
MLPLVPAGQLGDQTEDVPTALRVLRRQGVHGALCLLDGEVEHLRLGHRQRRREHFAELAEHRGEVVPVQRGPTLADGPRDGLPVEVVRLRQGAVVAGLLALLTAVQSLEYEVHLPGWFDAPVILLSALLAVVLPTGGVRMLRGGEQRTTPVLFDLAGLALLGGVLGWLLMTVAFYLYDRHAAPVPWSLAAAAVCSSAVGLSGRARFRK